MDAAAIKFSWGLLCKSIPVARKSYSRNPRQPEFDTIVMEANTELDQELDFLKKKYKLKNKENLVCEMAALGVSPDYQGKGIAKHLTRLLIENSKREGFWMSKAECSGAFSAKAMEKHGAKLEKFIDYKTWEFGGGCCSKPKRVFEDQVDKVAPHKGMSLMILRHFPEGKDSEGFVAKTKK